MFLGCSDVRVSTYFVRFCKLPEGADLLRLHAHRMAMMHFPKHADIVLVMPMCELLSKMLAQQCVSSVSDADKEAVIRKVEDVNFALNKTKRVGDPFREIIAQLRGAR